MRKQNRTRAGRFYDSSGRIISGLAIAAMAVAGFAMIPATTGQPLKQYLVAQLQVE